MKRTDPNYDTLHEKAMDLPEGAVRVPGKERRPIWNLHRYSDCKWIGTYDKLESAMCVIGTDFIGTKWEGVFVIDKPTEFHGYTPGGALRWVIKRS